MAGKTALDKQERVDAYNRNNCTIRESGLRYTVSDKGKKFVMVSPRGQRVHYFPATDKWNIIWNLYNVEARKGVQGLIEFMKGGK